MRPDGRPGLQYKTDGRKKKRGKEKGVKKPELMAYRGAVR